MTQLHENLSRQDSLVAKRGSERSFGFVFAVVFLLIGLFPLIRGAAPYWWSMAVAGAFALVALAFPAALKLPNRLWFKLGLFLGAIVGPVAIAIVYVVAVVPTGVLMRILGKDPLRLGKDPAARSYWVERPAPGPERSSMRNQF